MNDKQKIFVMVGVGSIAILIVTLLSPYFNLEYPFFSQYSLDIDAILAGKKHTNWFGMIAAFNVVVSVTGFFLYKDK